MFLYQRGGAASACNSIKFVYLDASVLVYLGCQILDEKLHQLRVKVCIFNL